MFKRTNQQAKADLLNRTAHKTAQTDTPGPSLRVFDRYGNFVSYYDSFNKDAPIDDINWQNTEGAAHAEDFVQLLSGKNNSAYNVFFHGRTDDPWTFANKTNANEERIFNEVGDMPVQVITMRDMQTHLQAAKFRAAIRNELTFREEGDGEGDGEYHQ